MIQIAKINLLPEEGQAALQKYAGQLEPLLATLAAPDKVENLEVCTEKYNNPEVSVIVPVYNVETYLFHSMSSILNQTCREIEVICVDDGSTDSSRQILEFFALLDARVQIIRHEKNLHAGVARNTGMAQAKGEYLFFFDPDDWCDPDLIAEAVENRKRFHADIILATGDKIDAETRKKSSDWNVALNIPEPFSRKTCPGNIFFTIHNAPWSRFCRREFLLREKLVFQDLHHSNDKYFCLMTLVLAQSITGIGKRGLYHHRVNTPNGLQNSKALSPLDPLNAYRAIKQHLDKLGITQEVMPALQKFIMVDLCFHEMLLCPPRGKAFEKLFADFHTSFLREFDLETVPVWATKEQKVLIQAASKRDCGQDCLLDLIQYYRSALKKKLPELQGKLRQTENKLKRAERELKQKKAEIQQLQKSVFYRAGQTVTRLPRMVQSTFRSLNEHGIAYTLKHIHAKFADLYRKFRNKRRS